MSWISNNIASLREYILEKQELTTRDQNNLFMLYNDSEDLKDITLFMKDCFENLLDPTIISIKITHNSIIVVRKNQDIQSYLNEKKYDIEKYNTDLIKPLESMYEKDEDDFLVLLRKSAAKIEWLFDVVSRGHLSQQDFIAISMDIKKLNPHFLELINVFGKNPQAYRLYEQKFAYENLMWDWYHKAHPFFAVISNFQTVALMQEPNIRDYIFSSTEKYLKSDMNKLSDDNLTLINTWEQITQMVRTLDNFDLGVDAIFQYVLKTYEELDKSQKLILQYHLFDIEHNKVAFTDDKFSVEMHTFDKIMAYLKIIAKDLTLLAQQDHSDNTLPIEDK